MVVNERMDVGKKLNISTVLFKEGNKTKTIIIIHNL